MVKFFALTFSLRTKATDLLVRRKRFPLQKLKPRILSVIYFDLFNRSTSDWFKTTKHCHKLLIELYQIEKFFQMQLALDYPPLILFRPLYLVLNFCMYIFSLCFLNSGFVLNTFSSTVILMLCTLWPF